MRKAIRYFIFLSCKCAFLIPALLKHNYIGEKKLEKCSQDLCAHMIMHINDDIVGCFADQRSEQLTHPKDAVVGIIYVCGEYFHAINIVKERSEARPCYDR